MTTSPDLPVNLDEFHEFSGGGARSPLFMKKAKRPMLLHQSLSPEGDLVGGIITTLDGLAEHLRTQQPADETAVAITAEGDRSRLE